MLGRLALGSRYRVGLNDNCLVRFVSLQDRVCCSSKTFPVSYVSINQQRNHLGPGLQIFLACRRKFVLILVGEAVEVLDVGEGECRTLALRTGDQRSRSNCGWLKEEYCEKNRCNSFKCKLTYVICWKVIIAHSGSCTLVRSRE